MFRGHKDRWVVPSSRYRMHSHNPVKQAVSNAPDLNPVKKDKRVGANILSDFQGDLLAQVVHHQSNRYGKGTTVV